MQIKNLNELELFDGDIPIRFHNNEFNRSYLTHPEIDPYLVYIVLKDTFKIAPKLNEDEEKIQWTWCFKYQDFYIEIYDWRLYSSSIGVYHTGNDNDKSQKLGDEICKLLNKAGQQKKSIKAAKAKFSKHRILENPFKTYYKIAENLIAGYGIMNKLAISRLELPFDKSDIWEQQSALYQSAFLMFLSSFEGFLNILYELYLKRELRNDRLYERISREQIDVKLRIAPIYCDGFKTKVINHEEEL